uniref:Reverse transcriptase n=1 Tax=Strongyloides stercoralis TaxID=6248 RepID=A0A0K0EG18_STRER
MLLPYLKGKVWERLHDHGFRYQTLAEGLYDLEMVLKLEKKNEKQFNNKHSSNKLRFSGQCNYCHKQGHKRVECRKRINDKQQTPMVNENSTYRRNNFIKKNNSVDLPLIGIGIDGGNYTALLDTGANIDIIRESVALRHNCEIKPNNNVIRQVFGSETKTLGSVNVKIMLKKKTYVLKLMCVKEIYIDNIYDIILDANSIAKLNMNINLSKKEVTIDNKLVDLIEVVSFKTFNISNLMLKQPVIDMVESINKICDIKPKLKEFIDKSDEHVESVFTASRQQFLTNTPHKFVKYQVPIKLRKYFDEELDYLIENKIIVPSDTPYLHNMILVKKSDNTYRTCIDRRETNKVTVVDQYPVGDLRETLSSLQGYTLFSTIDIKKAFQLIAIQPENQDCFGIYSYRGTYKYTKLPFGYVNSAQIFQRSIDSCLLKRELTKYAKAYFDDILVKTNLSVEHHLEVVASVLSVLMESRLSINLKKCKIACKAIEFLGHLIDGNRMSPSHANKECIKNMKVDKSITGIKRFLGATGFFCNLIPNYSYLCQPLTDLLSPKNKFTWTSVQDKAVEVLKSALSKCVVSHPNFNEPFEIYIDSSLFHHGAVIMQRDSNNVLVLVRFWSMKRKFTKKHRLSVYVELEGIVQLCRKFKYYLLGNKNIIQGVP